LENYLKYIISLGIKRIRIANLLPVGTAKPVYDVLSVEYSTIDFDIILKYNKYFDKIEVEDFPKCALGDKFDKANNVFIKNTCSFKHNEDNSLRTYPGVFLKNEGIDINSISDLKKNITDYGKISSSFFSKTDVCSTCQWNDDCQGFFVDYLDKFNNSNNKVCERVRIMKLKDKVAIVTGAYSGIGRAISLLFAREGAKVVITGKDKKKVDAFVEEIKDQGLNSYGLVVDVSDKESIKNLFSDIIEKFNSVDILINNAGIVSHSKLHDTSVEDWENIMMTNLTGVFLCCKYALSYMVKANQGIIINISSVMGISGGHGLSAYSASKGALIPFTKSLAMDYGRYGIRVNCICPGAVNTPMLDLSDQDKKKLSRIIPLGRIAEPNEIANVALFLSTNDSSYINGSIIVADGGGFD